MPQIQAGTQEAVERARAGGLAKAAKAKNKPEAHLAEIQAMLMVRLRSGTLTVAETEKLTRGYVEAEKLKRTIQGLPANTSQAIKQVDKPKPRPYLTGPIEEE